MITSEHIPAITHLVALHQTTPHHSPIHTSTHSVSPKLPHEISTVNPRMMDHSRCVSKGTLTYSTVPSRMPLYRSHAMPIRLDMRCTSHQTVTPTFARIHFSPGFLHNAPVTRVGYTSSFSRATTTPTPLSLGFTPFNVGIRATSPLNTHNLTTKPPHKNLSKTCSHLSWTLKPLTQTLTC